MKHVSMKILAIAVAALLVLCLVPTVFVKETDDKKIHSSASFTEGEENHVAESDTATPAMSGLEGAGGQPQPDKVESTEVKIFTVMFIDWNNAALYTDEFAEGKTIEAPEFDLNREGYVFKHWYLLGEDNTDAYAFGTNLTGDVTLKAYYTKIAVAPNGIGSYKPNEEIPEDAEGYRSVNTNADVPVEIGTPDPIGNYGANEEIIAEPIRHRSVRVVADVPNEARFGTIITLNGELIGYDGVAYSLQWRCDTGNGWSDIPGANDKSYSFELNKQSITYAFSLEVITIE